MTPASVRSRNLFGRAVFKSFPGSADGGSEMAYAHRVRATLFL
jgi:hypothetical protein